MRTLFFTVLMMLLLAITGCGGAKGAAGTSQSMASPSGSKVIITPETRLAGKVVTSDADARFAVLNFPIGQMPAVGQRLNVYRFGLKVGEIKVTGPQRDDNIVGDIVAGEARKGDDVREQ